LFFSDGKVTFPHGIKIGETTKSQVLEAYPAGSAHALQSSGVYDSGEEYHTDMLTYYYGFRDEDGELPEWVPPPWPNRFEIGDVNYLFDENEVLYLASIQWWYIEGV